MGKTQRIRNSSDYTRLLVHEQSTHTSNLCKFYY